MIKSLVEQIINHLETEKKIHCDDITTIIDEHNYDSYSKTKKSIKYFFRTNINDIIFKVHHGSMNSCFFLYKRNYLIIDPREEFDVKIKRLLDRWIDGSCACMICDENNNNYACEICQYIMCSTCWTKITIEEFKKTKQSCTRCPQCRTIMKKSPVELIYIE
jgi:hypothetical protein